MEIEILGELGADQLPDSVKSFFDGIVEVVQDRDLEALSEQLHHRVWADKASAPGHQNPVFRTHFVIWSKKLAPF